MSGWITFQSAKLARVDQFSVGVDSYLELVARKYPGLLVAADLLRSEGLVDVAEHRRGRAQER